MSHVETPDVRAAAPETVLIASGNGALYEQTAERLLSDILCGTVQPGDRLPSERQLCDRYQVSRVTLRSALRTLERRGVVDSSPSRGWFLRESLLLTDQPAGPTGVPGFSDLAAAKGLAARSRVKSVRVRPCTLPEAEALRVAPGADLFELRRVRYIDGFAISLEHNRVPLSICPELVDVDFEQASLYAVLRNAEPSQVPSVANYSVEARPGTAAENRSLGISHPIPLLVATQESYNQSGRPIELSRAACRSDRYQFRASIGNFPREIDGAT